MAKLPGNEARVAAHYNGPIFGFELQRLEASPIEFEITRRYLLQHVKPGHVVADVGVGGGQYAELLAQHGCRVHLVDISERLLEQAAQRLERAKLSDQLAGKHMLSAAALADFSGETLDALLMLGPFYHLTSLDDRRRAAREAQRLLRRGGILFAAGINRLAYLRDLLRNAGPSAEARANFLREVREANGWYDRYLRDGTLDPEHAPPIGHSHLTTVGEFRAQFDGLFEQIVLSGVESFANVWQAEWLAWPVAEREAWLDIIQLTSTTPEGLACADHFLFIGKRS